MSEAVLDIQFTSSGAETAAKNLDAVADKAVKAEAATDGLAAGSKRAGGALGQMIASIERQLGVLVELQRAQGGASSATAELAKTVERATAANDVATKATAGLAQAQRAASSAAQDMADSIRQVEAADRAAIGASTAQVAAVRAHTVGLRDFDDHVVRHLAQQKKATEGARLQSYQVLNLGRQFTDVGVSLASGQALWLVAIQQGAQIGEVFAEAKTQGVGFKSALTGIANSAVDMVKRFAPLLLTGAAFGGLALAAVAVASEMRKTAEATKALETATREANFEIFKASDAMLAASMGTSDLTVESLGAAHGIKAFGGEIGDAAVKLYDFAAAAKLATVNGLMAQQTALAARTADLQSRSAEGRAGALKGAWSPANITSHLGKRIGGDLASLWTFGESDRKIASDISAANAALSELQKTAKKVHDTDLSHWADDARKAIGDLGTRSSSASRASAAAAKDATDTIGLLTNTVQAEGETWSETAAIAHYAAIETRDLASAQQQLTTLADLASKGQIHFSSKLEVAAIDMDEAARAARELSFDIGDIAYAINGSDWTSALAGLVKVLAKVETAFKTATSAKDKYAAVAQLAQGVGAAVGGKGGAVVGGAGSGALAGLGVASSLTTLGLAVPGPGWALAAGGAVLGALGGLLGSSKEKKAQKAQEEAQRLAAEQARIQEVANQKRSLELALMEAQGWSFVALTAQRADELAKMDESNRALAQQVYAAQDLATARELDIQMLEAMGDAEGALEQRRNMQLTTLSEAHQAIQKQIWAEEVLTEARNAAADLAKQVAERRMSIQDRIDQLTLTSDELRAKARAKEMAEVLALDASLGPLLESFNRLEDATAAVAAVNAAVAKRDEEKTAAVTTARDALSQAYQRESAAIQQTRDRFAAFAKTLSEFRASLTTGDLAMNSPADQYRLTRAAFDQVSAMARLGNEDALSALPAASQAYLAASKEYQSTSLDYLRDLAAVKEAVEAAKATATRQVSVADRQLEALNSQVSGLISVNESVLTVAQAIEDLRKAMALPGDVKSVAGPTYSPVDNSSNAALKDGAFRPGDWNDPDYHDNLRALLDAQAAAQAAKSLDQLAAEQAAIIAAGKQWLAGVGGSGGLFGLPGFANGGSFTIGGNAGVDRNLMSINGQPAAWVGQGETVSISPVGRGSNDNDASALLAAVNTLWSEVALLRQDARTNTVAIIKSTDRGADTLESWDVDGLPAEREA